MRAIPLLVLMALALTGPAALGQQDSRNSFPGRRVGGGTRGVCTARLVAHLTPANNIQSAPRTLAGSFAQRSRSGCSFASSACFNGMVF